MIFKIIKSFVGLFFVIFILTGCINQSTENKKPFSCKNMNKSIYDLVRYYKDLGYKVSFSENSYSYIGAIHGGWLKLNDQVLEIYKFDCNNKKSFKTLKNSYNSGEIWFLIDWPCTVNGSFVLTDYGEINNIDQIIDEFKNFK